MTIAIVVQVHDGVVIASDSATTLTDSSNPSPANVINVYNKANKIFNLRKGLAIGAVTFGLGSMGSSSISTLAKDLRRRFSGEDSQHSKWALDPHSYTIEGVATQAREFFFEEKFLSLNLPQTAGSTFGFNIAGYSAGSELSEVWAVAIEGGRCGAPMPLIPKGSTDVTAGGDPEVFFRLLLGHGTALQGALLEHGVSASDLPNVMGALRAAMHIPIIEAPMPIQDAIDLARFLVRTTSDFARFRRGAATVGGPIEIAAITKHERFKWVQRKHYFDDVLNPAGAHQ